FRSSRTAASLTCASVTSRAASHRSSPRPRSIHTSPGPLTKTSVTPGTSHGPWSHGGSHAVPGVMAPASASDADRAQGLAPPGERPSPHDLGTTPSPPPTTLVGGTEMSTRTAAFFDLDKTIIATSSSTAFGRSFYNEGLLTRADALRTAYSKFLFEIGGADERQTNRLRDAMSQLER